MPVRANIRVPVCGVIGDSTASCCLRAASNSRIFVVAPTPVMIFSVVAGPDTDENLPSSTGIDMSTNTTLFLTVTFCFKARIHSHLLEIPFCLVYLDTFGTIDSLAEIITLELFREGVWTR